MDGSRSLYKLPVSGGTVTKLCETAASPRGLAWSKAGEILFGTVGNGLWRVSADGGSPEPLTTLASGELGHFDPNPLPGKRGLLFTVGRGGGQVALLPPNGTKYRVLIQGYGAAYVASGHLVFGRAGSAGLFAVPFDLETLEVQGPPIQLADTLALIPNWQPQFRVGDDGTLLYAPGSDMGSVVVWVDRRGDFEVVVRTERRYHTVRLSPDGKSFAADEAGGGGNHIWVHDLERGTRVLAVSGTYLQTPRFHPDGTRIAYHDLDDVFVKAADGCGSLEG